jgi:hypothetical protein
MSAVDFGAAGAAGVAGASAAATGSLGATGLPGASEDNAGAPSAAAAASAFFCLANARISAVDSFFGSVITNPEAQNTRRPMDMPRLRSTLPPA